MTQSEDNFIGRWSRRKKAQEKEAKIPQPATEDRELAAEQTAEPDREAGLEVSSQQAGDVESANPATTNEQLAEPVAPTVPIWLHSIRWMPIATTRRLCQKALAAS